MGGKERWQDWTSFALALWLALSPWLLEYSQHEAATANAVFVGIALALGSHFEASFDASSAEWLNMLAGFWLAVAPFLLGFASHPEAAASSVGVGVLVAVLAASAMSLDKEIGKLWHKRAPGQ